MDKEYKKISSTRRVVKIHKLWRGKDHLLFSEAEMFVERYKRFYFRDIQAFLISPSSERVVWNFVWGFFLVLLVTLGWSLKSEGALFVFFLSVLSFLAVLVNTALGPGCAVHLKTAIQTVRLPISRRRKAEKIIRLLRPAIEEAQQSLPEIPVPTPVSPSPTAPGIAAVSPAFKKFRSQAHWGLFFCLFLMAVIVGVGYVRRGLPLYFLEMTLYFASTLFSVVALIWQSKTGVSPFLRKITVGTFFFIALNYVVGTGWAYSLLLGHPEWINNYWGMVKWVATQPLEGSAFRTAFAGFQVVVSSLLGIIGLLEMVSYQRRSS